MAASVSECEIPADRVFTDLDACLAGPRPDLAILCSATATHAEFVERLAPRVGAILVEKPFAASLAEADRMIAACATAGTRLAINWPLAWYPCHVTARRLIAEGVIGEVIEVHYYDGNPGPLSQRAQELGRPLTTAEKASTWWYKRASGGGSMLDYLGYGVTLGTWFMDGRAPLEVATMTAGDPALEVDEHSVTIARYATGLSRFETRWGTFTAPWVTQPQPKCGFVVVGRDGTISSYDYEPHVTVQTRDKPSAHKLPVDELPPGRRNPVEYILDCIARDRPPEGPLDPAICRTGQRIIETALISAAERRVVELVA
jgi:glucose-fructose oxidoreductase